MSAEADYARDAHFSTRPPMARAVYHLAAERYRDLDAESPEFHYAVRAAMEAPTDRDVVARLLEMLAQSASVLLKVRAQLVREASMPSIMVLDDCQQVLAGDAG